ncbi:MAG TPA: hypothetical protein VIK95_07285 [Egibacteraceae bacterium]
MLPHRRATARYRESFLQRDRIAELEGLLARAHPAALTVDFGGWQVRRSRGGLPHADSVWPRASLESRPLDERIASVERFYAGAGLPPRFLIGPGAQPRGLERALLARGYRRSSVHQVRTLSLEAFASRAESGAGAATATVAADGPTGAWLDGWGAAAGVSATARETTGRLLARVADPAAFAVASVAGQPVGYARGIAYGGWLGVDLLATTAARPDVGAALAAALAVWAADHDAEQVHLHVDSGDAAAALVADLGGRVALSYRFFERDLAAVSRPPARRGSGPAPSPS